VKLRLRAVNVALLVLLVVVMGAQVGFDLPLGKRRFAVTIADVVLALAAVGVALQLLARKLRGVRLPPLQALVLVGAGCVALARSEAMALAARELLQLAEYFLVAFAVFLNIAERYDLKPLLWAFGIATGGVVAWAGWHYATRASAFDVSAGFANRNALGAFLALALPVLYGLALHVRGWGIRAALLVMVAAGLLVNLSGGAVFVTLAVLGVLSAVRGLRALGIYVGAVALVAMAAPRLLPRPHHTDALFASVAPFVGDNFLLDDAALFARARELSDAGHESMAKARAAGALVVPSVLAEAGRALGQIASGLRLSEAERKSLGEALAKVDEVRSPYPHRALFDARYLMEFLRKRRGGDRGLRPDERQLYRTLVVETSRAAELFPEAARASVFAERRVAVRYQRWDAALACARSLWDSLPNALFGLGYVDYHAAVEPFRPQAKFQYFSNLPEAYNVATSEPFTHAVWFKALVQTGLAGLLALAWLVAAFLGRAVRLYGAAHSELMLGLALGAAGGILGFALVGVFTETLARGLAIPFVFVCSLVVFGERIVRGEKVPELAQLARAQDY